MWKSLEAADQLEKEDGLSVEVLDLRTLLPMDDAAIMQTVQKTNKVLIVGPVRVATEPVVFTGEPRFQAIVRALEYPP